MKTTRHRICTLGFALAFAASSLHATTSTLPAPKPEFLNSEQLAEWRAKKTVEFEAKQAQEVRMRSVEADVFYTGKPYLEETGTYAFRFRSYDPELSRWTSEDPSGFPDGPNNYCYSSAPLSGVDPDGLAWTLLNYVYHFVVEGGAPVSLADMGLLQGVKDLARSSGGAIALFSNSIAGYADSMFKPYDGQFSLGFGPRFDNYSSVSWPIGLASTTGYFIGAMTSTPNSSGRGGVYSYTGTATVSFQDTFSDPYNILERLYGNSNTLDAPWWLQLAANGVIIPGAPLPLYIQGTPFAIAGSWTEDFSGGGTYE